MGVREKKFETSFVEAFHSTNPPFHFPTLVLTSTVLIPQDHLNGILSIVKYQMQTSKISVYIIYTVYIITLKPLKIYSVLCFGKSSKSRTTEEDSLYFMRLSSVYHIRTSWAFLFSPRAAIPSARLPPVTLASTQ